MDYKKLDKLINSRYIFDGFHSFDTAYLTTTENIADYMPGMLDQDVLAVCSSGDHFLNAIYQGAKSVDLFDINEFSYVVLNLKIAAVKALNYEDFLTFFGIINRFKTLNYKLYLKVRECLNDEYKEIFDYIYKCCNSSGQFILEGTSLFYKNTDASKIIIESSIYLTVENYNYLKELLNEEKTNINFIHANVFDLPLILKKKYDSIFLSNISDYNNSKRFIWLVNELRDFLNDNGLLYFAYLYGCHENYDDKTFKEFLSSREDCYSTKVSSVYRDKYNEKIYDKVLMLRKY